MLYLAYNCLGIISGISTSDYYVSYRVDKEDELQCLIKGCNFVLHKIPNEMFEFHRDQSSEYVFRNLLDSDLFPYLLVNIGSGVSIIKVCLYKLIYIYR